MRIHPGSTVYMNPDSFEIVRQREKETSRPNNTVSDRLSENFLHAVKPYSAEPYEKIDCCELVVKGLKNMGFRYQGPGGLKEH